MKVNIKKKILQTIAIFPFDSIEKLNNIPSSHADRTVVTSLSVFIVSSFSEAAITVHSNSRPKGQVEKSEWKERSPREGGGQRRRSHCDTHLIRTVTFVVFIVLRSELIFFFPACFFRINLSFQVIF